jgi:hypothetical protein
MATLEVTVRLAWSHHPDRLLVTAAAPITLGDEPCANARLHEKPTLVTSVGLHLQGFIRGRKAVQLFKHPDGWCEGMFTRRCIRKRQPSDSAKYDDGFEYNQPCERSTYGTGLEGFSAT